MREELSKTQTEKILKALDDAIETGPWDKSNFLRLIGKGLDKIRNEFSERVSAAQETEVDAFTKLHNKMAAAHENAQQQEIFIALYCSQGTQLRLWERILANLPRQVVSRPVYEKEEDALHKIKASTNRNNEAYVGVYISPQKILPQQPGKELQDRFGRPLLYLLDNAVQIEHMTRFVHISGEYFYNGRRLVKIE